MLFGPKTSVRAQLTVGLFLVVCLSWFLSSAATNYLAYRDVLAIHRFMLERPDDYPMPIPEPRLDLFGLFTGPRSFFRPEGRGGRGPDGGPPPGGLERPGPPPGLEERPEPQDGPPRDRPGRLPPAREVALRTGIALALALAAGSWLSWRFTRPLTALAEGARALSDGRFETRVGERGSAEYSELAAAMNEMAARVSRQIEELREEAGRRRQLLADVAHELRGPVMTPRTMAGALADGVASDDIRRAQAEDALLRNSERLLRLVNDLLELARLDLHELPLHCRPVDVRELAAAAVRSIQPAAREAGVAVSGPEPGPVVTAEVDPDRVTEILENLLTNAVSYAGRGAQCRVTVDGPGPVRLVVADTGAGIAEEHQPYVFDAFYRADAARSPAGNHSGLGLKIARALAEAHGGRLTLESVPGQGTTVTVILSEE